jgi:hypothetical protein
MVTHPGWWLLERMLERTTAVLGPGLEAPVSREQIEQAWLPAGLKTILADHLGAAAAIEEQSSYAILRAVVGVPPIVRHARTDTGYIRLVAIARNEHLVDSDPLVFARLGENDTVANEPECFITELEEGESWRANRLGYTFDRVLPWRWAWPFTSIVYPVGDEVMSLDWNYSLDEMATVLDRGLGLKAGATFEAGWVVGRIEERGAWLAVRRIGNNFRLCLGGERDAVRRLQELKQTLTELQIEICGENEEEE